MDDDWSLFCFGNPKGDFQYMTADHILYKMADKLKNDQAMYVCTKTEKNCELFMKPLMCDFFYDHTITTDTPKGMDNLCLLIDFLEDRIEKEDFLKVFNNPFICKYENHEKFLESKKDSLSDLFLKLNRLLLREYLLIYSKKNYDSNDFLNPIGRALCQHLQRVELPDMLLRNDLFEQTQNDVTFDDFVKHKKTILKKKIYKNIQEEGEAYIESLKNKNMLKIDDGIPYLKYITQDNKIKLHISKADNVSLNEFRGAFTDQPKEIIAHIKEQYEGLLDIKEGLFDIKDYHDKNGVYLNFEYYDFSNRESKTRFDKLLLYILKNDDDKIKNVITLFLLLIEIFDDPEEDPNPINRVDSYILTTRLIMLVLSLPQIREKQQRLWHIFKNKK